MVIKTDDDMYINLAELVRVVKASSPALPLLTGFLMCGLAPIRDPTNKVQIKYSTPMPHVRLRLNNPSGWNLGKFCYQGLAAKPLW